MTHLSDFSYLQRCMLEAYITAYLVHHLWVTDRFRCLKPSKVLAGELRSIITYLMFIMMLTQSTWDIISTWIKYSEGFMYVPANGQVITKPFQFWDPYHQKFIQPIDYVECITFSFQTGVFFLLQCFWHYLSNTVAKKSFMGSWEFKFYILWAVGSFVLFPVLQWRWRDDELYSEVIPQLAYGIEVLITAALGVRSHFRFSRLLRITKQSLRSQRTKSTDEHKSDPGVTTKIEYFRDMNVLLVIILTLYGASLIILCADGLTTSMTINTNKFATDLLIANCNMCVICLWLIFISIFHPRRSYLQRGPSNSNKVHTAVTYQEDTELAVNERRLSERVTRFIINDSTKRYNNKGDIPNQQPDTMPHAFSETPASPSPPHTSVLHSPTTMGIPSYYGVHNSQSHLVNSSPRPSLPSAYDEYNALEHEIAQAREFNWLQQSPERRAGPYAEY
ncbi:hypothetical protein VTP01DRAFT_2967 [Rhizomucor pusillus]|uniref:uncharacterized protein n=1 Tax=Rhizomucor pusillus TaxID=4840 RepID=UPI0037434266